jgi:asparagine synthase (glutamine-hydrolysing)
MAHSLESRTPLCDDELLDFALSIPLQTKLTNFELKHIPRTAMKGRLPSLIYTLPKRGFPTPLAHWFKNELKTFIREFILDNVEFAPFLCKRETEKIIDNHCNQKLTTPLSEFSAHKVWILLNLVVYMRNQKRRYVV